MRYNPCMTRRKWWLSQIYCSFFGHVCELPQQREIEILIYTRCADIYYVFLLPLLHLYIRIYPVKFPGGVRLLSSLQFWIIEQV